MGADNIPEQDSKAANWMRNFASGLQTQPVLYNVTPVQAGEVADAVQAYRDALAIAITVSTRTKGSVAAKNTARRAAERICRNFARLIKFNDAISNADKFRIGLKPVKKSRTPRLVPRQAPLFSAVIGHGGVHQLLVHDTVHHPRNRKPLGAACVQLFAAVGDDPEPDCSRTRFIGSFTKAKFSAAHTPADVGKIATYYVRWAGRRGDVGDFAPPRSLRIAA